MRAKLFISLASAALVLLLGLGLAHPPVIRANGEKDEEKGGHAHVPAPLEYADTHVPLNVWTDQAMIGRGNDIYTTRRAACHGDEGKGDGSVGPMLSPRRATQPRDFTSAEFKFRSTPSGQLPTTADLFRTVTEGVRSSGGPMTIGLRGHRIMPSFRYMPAAQRLEVIEYVKSLNRGFWERRVG